MAGILRYPRRQPKDAEEQQAWLVDLVDQLETLLFPVIKGVTIGTSETPVAHGQRGIPKTMLLIPHANATWWETRDPDAKCGYFAASTSVVCDVKVFP